MASSVSRWCLGTFFGDTLWHLGTIVAQPVLPCPALAVSGPGAMAIVSRGPVIIVGLVGGTFEG